MLARSHSQRSDEARIEAQIEDAVYYGTAHIARKKTKLHTARLARFRLECATIITGVKAMSVPQLCAMNKMS